MADLRKPIVCVPKATRHATAWDQVTSGFVPAPRPCAAGQATTARSISQSSMRVENLTALARRFRGPAPQRLRSVLTSGRGPVCGGERTLEALKVLAHSRAPALPGAARAGVPTSRPALPSRLPGFCRRGLGDARRDGALRFSFVSRFLFSYTPERVEGDFCELRHELRQLGAFRSSPKMAEDMATWQMRRATQMLYPILGCGKLAERWAAS